MSSRENRDTVEISWLCISTSNVAQELRLKYCWISQTEVTSMHPERKPCTSDAHASQDSLVDVSHVDSCSILLRFSQLLSL